MYNSIWHPGVIDSHVQSVVTRKYTDDMFLVKAKKSINDKEGKWHTKLFLAGTTNDFCMEW